MISHPPRRQYNTVVAVGMSLMRVAASTSTRWAGIVRTTPGTCGRAITSYFTILLADPSGIQYRFATKKAGGSSKNGRDSESKRLGVKIYGG